MTEITVTRALTQVKTLDERIAGFAQKSEPVVSYKIGQKSAGGRPVAEVEQLINASFQSVQDLIKQRNAIKAAIIRSNSDTKVSIGGVEMTVAEAIERKGSIRLEAALLQTMKAQLAAATQKVEQSNRQMEADLQQLMVAAVGKDRQVGEAELSAIRDPFVAQKQASLIDPLNLAKQIAELDASITGFTSEVDFVLSESNAITKIVV